MLTDAAVRKAKPRDKAFKLADSGGLFLFVTPSGGKLWRYRYRFEGREKVLSFGPYPAIGLIEARAAREAAKAKQRDGRDPSLANKMQKLAGAASNAKTFEAMAREWYERNKGQWAARHASDVITSLEREVFPALGNIPITEIGPPAVIGLLQKVENRGAEETARRLRQRMSAVFQYALAKKDTGIEIDPAAMVQKAMAPVIRGRQPAVTDLDAARKMLAKAEAEHAHPVTKLALRILALTAVRPGTLITTPWHEWPEDCETWEIPAARMKLRLQHKDDEKRNHLVPLATQTIEAVAALRTMTGRGPIAFPNTRHAHKPMSENAIGYLLNRAGYHGHHVPHGWRSTFSTVMNERYRSDRHLIDLMLAHISKDKTEGAYNRALHLERRRELAQAWADLILKDARPAIDLLSGPRR
jgi:integrase